MSQVAEQLAALRAQLPVLQRLTYLNAGTNGPIPAVAADAVRVQIERETAEGRGDAVSFGRVVELAQTLRERYAALLGAAPADVALSTSTTDGIARMLLALGLQPGEEIVTSDEEHPGLLGPLTAQMARGVEVRVAPFAQLADAVGPRTRLVACSHVSWRSGRIVDVERLAQLDVTLLLDGAQSVGAISFDVAAFGPNAIYAGSGQKWLCGANGTGMLFVSPSLRKRLSLRPVAPGIGNLADANTGLDAVPHADARAFDTPKLSAVSVAQSLAALELFEQTGWAAMHAHAADLAAIAADALRNHGRTVLERDRTTLVTWQEPDAVAVAERLATAGVIVRSLPNEDLLRASFGGWSTTDDLERLLSALPAECHKDAVAPSTAPG